MIKFNTTWEYVEFYQSLGFNVIPFVRGDKRPAVKWETYKEKKLTEPKLRGMFDCEDRYNVGIISGAISGDLVVLDCDSPETFDLVLKHLDLGGRTLITRTARGSHIFMRTTTPFRSFSIPSLKLDVQSEVKLVVLPPSLHPSGVFYYFDDASVAEIPYIDNLEARIKQLGPDTVMEERDGGQAAHTDETIKQLLEDTREGGRHTALVKLTNYYRATTNWPIEQIKMHLMRTALEWPCDNPMTEEEIEREIEKAFYPYLDQGRGKNVPGQIKAMPEEFKAFGGDLEELKGAFPEGEIPYLIEGLLASGGDASMLISGESGEGKSTLAEVALVSSTQGKPVLNKHRVPFPLRFALIDYEATQSRIAKDIDLMIPVLGAPVQENVLILTPTGEPFDVMNPACVDWLWSELKKFKPHVVWHDSIYGFVSQLVNDEDRAVKVREFFNRIVMHLGAGVVIGHHTKSTGEFASKSGFDRTMGILGKRLYQWAATKLTYSFLPEFKNFGILEGSTRIGPWHPIRIILQYHQPTKTVWEIDPDMIALDDKEKRELLGEDPKVTELKQLLLELDMVGMLDAQKAAKLGVNQSTISRWRSGKRQPEEEKLEDLRQLVKLAGPWSAAKGQATARQKPGKKLPALATIEEVEQLEARPGGVSGTQAHEIEFLLFKDTNGACSKCSLKHEGFVGGEGEALNDILIVGEAPGKEEALAGKPFVGQAGEGLDVLLEAAHIDRSLCRITNLVKCRPPKNRDPHKKEIECCSRLLEQELNHFKPKMVITLGRFALKRFDSTPLSVCHGMRIAKEGFELVPMYHPAAALHQPALVPVLQDDFDNLSVKAVSKQLRGNYQYSPSLKLSIPRFPVAIDCETAGKKRDSELLGVGFCWEAGKAVYQPRPAAQATIMNQKISATIMQNAKFDLQVLANNNVPMSQFGLIDDTMVLAYCMNLQPLGLKELVLRELGYEMERYEDVVPQGGSLKDVPLERVAAYCAAWSPLACAHGRLYCIIPLHASFAVLETTKTLPAYCAKPGWTP